MTKGRSKEEIKLRNAYEELFPALALQGTIMGASQALIQDSIHDIFVELLEKKAVTSKIENFKSYISTALRRKLAKEMKISYATLEERELNSQLSYETLLIQKQSDATLKLHLKNALTILSDKEREVIKLRFYDGLSYEEISVKNNCSIRTTYNQFHSAIKKLRKHFSLSDYVHKPSK